MYVEIGAYLRQAREAIGFTLDDVQEKTKIQKSFLIAIENGDFDKLPSPFYVRTYLRYYANCVKVEPHHILRAYRKAEQAVRYGIEPASNSLQNTVRIPIINLNTGPQQSVAQTTGKHSTRRINAQTALTIAKAPQTTGKIPQTTGTNPKFSSLAQESGQRFATGPQPTFGNTQKLPTIASRPGQTSQTTQRMSAITQKLPTIAQKLQNTDPGRSRSNLQNTGSHSLFHTGAFSAVAGQEEAAASAEQRAEQRAQTNPNLRLSNTNPRMQINAKAGLEQSIPPQRTGSPASSSLDNTLGKTSRLRRVGSLQNTNPPQPPAHEPEADELQSTRSYRRGGTRKSGFSIPKNRLMPIAIMVAVLSVFALGMIFLFGGKEADQKAQKPNTVVQTPIQAKASENQQAKSNANPPATEVKVERVEGKDTYNLIGTNKAEIEVIPVNGDSVVMIYDAYQKGKVLDEVTVKAGGASYKYSIELTDKQHHVYIKLGNPDAVKVKVNGFDIEKPKQQWIRIKLPQYD